MKLGNSDFLLQIRQPALNNLHTVQISYISCLFSFYVFLIAHINSKFQQRKKNAYKLRNLPNPYLHIGAMLYPSNMINDYLKNYKFSIRRFVGWRSRRQWIRSETIKAKENTTIAEKLKGVKKEFTCVFVFACVGCPQKMKNERGVQVVSHTRAARATLYCK